LIVGGLYSVTALRKLTMRVNGFNIVYFAGGETFIIITELGEVYYGWSAIFMTVEKETDLPLRLAFEPPFEAVRLLPHDCDSICPRAGLYRGVWGSDNA